MGLCMGFSFVSAAEMIYYLGVCLLNLCRTNSDNPKDNENHWAARRKEED